MPEIERVVDLMLDELRHRLAERQITVRVTDAAPRSRVTCTAGRPSWSTSTPPASWPSPGRAHQPRRNRSLPDRNPTHRHDINERGKPMAMNRQVWVPALRGVLAIVFGIIALIWPGITALALALLFGAFVLVNGVMLLIGAFRGRADGGQRPALIVAGILGVLAGVITLIWPGVTTIVGVLILVRPGVGAVALAQVLGIYAIIVGVLMLVASWRASRTVSTPPPRYSAPAAG